jgi:hypothetical protein
MATKAKIRDRTAEFLGILPVGQTLENQYVTRLNDAYAEVYEDLKEKGIAYWSFGSEVPTKFVPHVVALVAENALTLGASKIRTDKILIKASVAVSSIRELGAENYESTANNVDF